MTNALKTRVLATAAGIGVSCSAVMLAVAHQGTPSQPGQPAQSPRPQSPQPRPTPAATGQQQPPPAQAQPTPADQAVNRLRNARPFAFQTPQAEAAFTDTSQRLVRLEQKMERSNQDLLKRLGEVRQLTPERQGPAMFDLLQQLLTQQAEMQRYLVQARTAWTGDIETVDGAETAPIQAAQPTQPQGSR